MSHRGTARASRMMRADEKSDEIEHKANTIENASTNLGGYENSLSSHGIRVERWCQNKEPASESTDSMKARETSCCLKLLKASLRTGSTGEKKPRTS